MDAMVFGTGFSVDSVSTGGVDIAVVGFVDVEGSNRVALCTAATDAQVFDIVCSMRGVDIGFSVRDVCTLLRRC